MKRWQKARIKTLGDLSRDVLEWGYGIRVAKRPQRIDGSWWFVSGPLPENIS